MGPGVRIANGKLVMSSLQVCVKYEIICAETSIQIVNTANDDYMAIGARLTGKGGIVDEQACGDGLLNLAALSRNSTYELIMFETGVVALTWVSGPEPNGNLPQRLRNFFGK